jgi:3-isopropylmalate/(R)-2-methylmalate dehydratase small subunit
VRPFDTHCGVAVPFDAINMDTDQILPARYLRKRKLDPDYQTYLFHDLRFRPDGTEIKQFPLNHPAWRQATIAVGNTNFGGGSSREAAAFAFDAYGFRCVIAPNFGDIFYSNCLKNGILPVVLAQNETDRLRSLLHTSPGSEISVDLEAQIIRDPDGRTLRFEIEAFQKQNLLVGLSPIGLTLENSGLIDAFEADYRAKMPWL